MNLANLNPTTRFSDRVQDYVRYRPSYPPAVFDYLNSKFQLEGARVADIGAGTGIFSRLLVGRGASVDAVEPNFEMRQAMLSDETSNLFAREGTAEQTGLVSSSVDLVTCAQAFHWFDPVKTRQEFDRILKPNGLVALIWNDQNRDYPVSQAYEQVKAEFGENSFETIKSVTSGLEQVFPKFFKNAQFESQYFANFQELSLEGFIGRFFSSSYSPAANSALRPLAIEALKSIFEKYQQNGLIRLEYTTEISVGY